MGKRTILLSFVLLIMLGFLSYNATFALFSDASTSTNNIFAAAQVFPTPVPSPGDVVINEIMWMGSQGNAADEWIELRNMTSSTIDLSNWTVVNLATGPGGTVTIPSGKTIGPNGFFLISNDPESTSKVSITPDVVAPTQLLDPGEQLTLKNASSVTIDTANGTGEWLAGQNGVGQNPEKSMERNDTPSDGTVGSNWHTATSATNIDAGGREIATPKASNSSP